MHDTADCYDCVILAGSRTEKGRELDKNVVTNTESGNHCWQANVKWLLQLVTFARWLVLLQASTLEQIMQTVSDDYTAKNHQTLRMNIWLPRH